MKKIFISIMAVAALAACTKSEVAYEQPSEIGFKAVAGNITKTAVSGDEYPEALGMYVYAWTTDFAPAADNYYPNYINKGLFVHKGQFESYTGKTGGENPHVWGGETPYYWPNTKSLHFAGYSASGNVETLAPTYDCRSNTLSIVGYAPGTGENNDLMFFPTTAISNTAGYDKDTDYVSVDMYHTCAWITFKVQGDGVTGISTSNYAVESLTVTNIYETGDLTCLNDEISWNFSTNAYPKSATSSVLSEEEEGATDTAIPLADTYDSATDKFNPVKAENPVDNTVLLPQLPGMLELTYSYISPAGVKITETRSGVTALDLTLDGSAVKTTEWEAGKHYIYTITIKANEILIAPTPDEWVDGTPGNITVE